jgi:hypothetical protein
MRRWIPNDSAVDANEHIGRRLYDEPKLFGASDQNQLDGLQLRHFEATSDNEFSVDRVGKGCCNKGAIAYLLPRANDAGSRGQTSKTFHGWLTVPARRLTAPAAGIQWSLIPSPDRGPKVDGADPPWSDDNLRQNIYHAHVPVPRAGPAPTRDERALFAFRAREVFVKGQQHLAGTPQATPARRATLREILRRVWLRAIGRAG